MLLFPILATVQSAFHQLPFAVTFILGRKKTGIVGIKPSRKWINGRTFGDAEQPVNFWKRLVHGFVIVVSYAITVYVRDRITF